MNTNIPELPVIEPLIHEGLTHFLQKAIAEEDLKAFVTLVKLQLRMRTLELARQRQNSRTTQPAAQPEQPAQQRPFDPDDPTTWSDPLPEAMQQLADKPGKLTSAEEDQLNQARIEALFGPNPYKIDTSPQQDNP